MQVRCPDADSREPHIHMQTYCEDVLRLFNSEP